jgi:hypothetical protein
MPTASPPIVSRAAWGANPVNTPAATIATPTRDLWLHHTGSSGLHGAGGMRSLQANARSGGYVDLEYTVVVDTDGQIYMSRGIGRDTAATGGNNSTSHAICAMGNFENDTPTNALLDSIASCVMWLFANRAIQQNVITGPHRDAPGNSTACCGRNLIAQIANINARVAGGAGPTPTPPPSGGAPLTTVASPRGAQGRVGTARPVPAFGTVQLDNGASLKGDTASGRGRVWVNPDQTVKNTKAPLLDIAPTIGTDGKPDGRGIVALYDLGGGNIGTYVVPWS